MIRWFAETGGRLRGAISFVYLAVLITAPVMDAAIEAFSFEQVTHIESQKDSPCVAGHDEVMCQLCRLIEVPGLAMARVRVDVPPRSRPYTTQQTVATPSSTAHCDSNPSRAPPLV